MKFTRLRLSGFKSFVEPTELHIEAGLTAVVGPNGCGKSNLFDALRWVMGETRPTSVRGAEMDDVIFAGSAGRPSRNVAEVTLFVDNADRSASAPYNEYDQIEISRKIEREAGSVYRINGRDVRQRDVQLFFADASSGAASTAFVRQGQIGMLVSAKPLNRRAILEEAAGISRPASAPPRGGAAPQGRRDQSQPPGRHHPRDRRPAPRASKRQARQGRALSAISPATSARPKRWRTTCAGPPPSCARRAAEEALAAAAAAVTAMRRACVACGDRAGGSREPAAAVA